jgi:hypothetical protein
MTTSGTTAFNLDLNNLVEEAFERCGSELRSGYDLRTARRSLNLLLLEWANRGLNLWTLDQGQIALAEGQGLYPLPTDTIDLLDTVIRQYPGANNQVDINITRIAEPTYITIPNKLTTGRPVQLWVNRQSGTEYTTSATLDGGISASATTITVSGAMQLPSSGFIKVGSETISYANITGDNLENCARGQNGTTAAAHLTGAAITRQNLPCVYIWPTPNAPGAQYTLIYYRMKRMQDAGEGGAFNQEIPFRFLPCLVAGLAYYLAQKLPEGGERLGMLKQEYEQQWQLAADEDRDKAPVRFVPRNMMYR